MTLGPRLIPPTFNTLPSQDPHRVVGFLVPEKLTVNVDAVGFGVDPDGDGARAVGLDAEALERLGFRGAIGDVLLVARDSGPVQIAVGVGPVDERSPGALRDAAAAFARAAARFSRLALDLGVAFALPPRVIGQMIAEGATLARYRYTVLQPSSTDVPLVSVDIVTAPKDAEETLAGIAVAAATSRAAMITRDLSNAPPGHLTATNLADAAVRLGELFDLEVEVFDLDALIELGCGGLLGVNAGSAEEPRMIRITYSPQHPEHHVALVGKGITYDAGGISLKPSDAMHLLMKMDMAGAAAVLGAMTGLGALGCRSAVTGYLMCTDNVPSGTAIGLGDVLTIRGGTTVEIKNTDAEGRLVMADALVLAAEQRPDAILDIATLTGSALQTLGPRVAAVFGNNQAIVDQLIAAAERVDEPIWQLPLEHRYRRQLDSTYADIANMGGPFNVAITAALFLNEFVGDIPWGHLDIAGTMQSERDESWRSTGATGFGARLLLDALVAFEPVRT